MCAIYILVLSSPLVSYFCDWAVFTLSGGEQLGVQHPAKCYSSSLMFRPTSIVAGLCTRSFSHSLIARRLHCLNLNFCSFRQNAILQLVPTDNPITVFIVFAFLLSYFMQRGTDEINKSSSC